MNVKLTPGAPEIPDRREFIANTARSAAAATLLGITWFATRNQGGNACRNVPMCGQCPVFEGCGLPRAEEWRGQEERREA